VLPRSNNVPTTTGNRRNVINFYKAMPMWISEGNQRVADSNSGGTGSVNRYEGFNSNGAVVLSDSRGTFGSAATSDLPLCRSIADNSRNRPSTKRYDVRNTSVGIASPNAKIILIKAELSLGLIANL
jgi:hypothetical protein